MLKKIFFFCPCVPFFFSDRRFFLFFYTLRNLSCACIHFWKALQFEKKKKKKQILPDGISEYAALAPVVLPALPPVVKLIKPGPFFVFFSEFEKTNTQLTPPPRLPQEFLSWVFCYHIPLLALPREVCCLCGACWPEEQKKKRRMCTQDQKTKKGEIARKKKKKNLIMAVRVGWRCPPILSVRRPQSADCLFFFFVSLSLSSLSHPAFSQKTKITNPWLVCFSSPAKKKLFMRKKKTKHNSFCFCPPLLSLSLLFPRLRLLKKYKKTKNPAQNET